MVATTNETSSKGITRKELPHVEMTLKGHEGDVRGIAFIAGTRLLVTGSDDKSLRVWDLDTGKQVGEPLWGHDAEVWRIAASPDGHWIASGGWNGSILVWEVATNKRELKRVPVSFKGHEDVVRDIVFAPDNKTFASASLDGMMCVWNRQTGKIVLGPLKVGDLALSVSYSPDGTKLAAGTNEHIIIWNSASGKELLKIEQRAFRVAFTVTPDGLRLVSVDQNDIRISDATTGDIIKQFDAHTEFFLSLAIAPNGTKFATTSYDKTTRFFDLTTFEPIDEPLEHPDLVWCVAFSEDSKLIATGCKDSYVRTWTVPLVESERELQQVKIFLRAMPHADSPVIQFTEKILEKTIPRQQSRRAPIPTSRFFDDFDPHPPPGRNNPAATATRHAEGSGIKNIMNRLFSRISPPQDHTPRSRSIPLVDVFATRGKYRTANAHSGKRDKLLQLQRPPRKQSYAGASSSSTPLAVTSNVADETTPATLQTGNTSAANNPPSLLDVEHVSDIGCFAAFTSESEKELQQSTHKILNKTIPDPRPRPKRAPIPTSRFFDDFDSTERNNRAGTTRNAKGSKIKNVVDRIFSRSSTSQGHTPRILGVPLVDVSATRGKYRTANAHSGKRDKLLRLQRPPRNWQAHAGASSSSTLPAETSNVVNEATPATSQTGSTRPSSSLDVAHAPHSSCFAVLARCLPCLSRPASGSH
ncbi:WD40-repeat-containing domain protein [Suillus fuscotomentosus]|uniref:WD40-repeat-containing domain protein n=1 Tax=Suillus fuscotomentosus TaxID=1912939 RepID=A0AAD4DSS5_9AGAM|nr:WD40-repeat-containing domain protein [Suillus fuscotomentosus]KAG1893275.1 WD40-repeat-containing domain protein [Suillus fuscotomentosus]